MKSEFGRAPEKGEKKETKEGGVEEEEPRREWLDLEEDDRLLRSGIFSGFRKKGDRSLSALQKEGRKEQSRM